MVCGACGYENQVGNRFCGMCGTPLPHRPLTAPGAHGTHTFMRLPLESAKLERERVEVPAEDASASAPPARGAMLTEMPLGKQAQVQNSGRSADMVPEVPLDEYIKSFRYVPPAEPDEITMRGEAHVPQPEARTVNEAASDVVTEATTAADSDLTSATEDVDKRLGLEEPAPGDERHDRPRFLDFSEPASPAEKPEGPQPAIPGPSFLGLDGTSKAAVAAPNEREETKSGDRLWIGIAVVALLTFVFLGVLEWRLQGSGTSPVEIVKLKLQDLWHGNRPVPQQANSTEATAAKSATQFEGESKPQSPDQSPPVDTNGASPTRTSNPPATQTNPAPSAQNTATVRGAPPTDGPKIAPGTPSSAGPQSAATQKAIQPKTTPPLNTAEIAAGSEAKDVKGQKKAAPGDEELSKANDASDATAAAAWLWRATAKGNPDAPVRLADMYVKGEGVPRSCDQAVVLLKAAASKENAPARNRLAAMYNSGTCVQRNRVEAYRWLNSALAADPNSQWALQNRNLIWQQMTPEEQAAAKPNR